MMNLKKKSLQKRHSIYGMACRQCYSPGQCSAGRLPDDTPCNCLDEVQALIPLLLAEMFPGTATDLLSEWEKRYGVIVPQGATVNARRMAIKAKRLRKWGLSIPIYIELAATLGYDISIEESGQPFRADISKAGDKVIDDEYIWVALITVNGLSSAPELEALFTDIFPPYVRLEFSYQ